MIWGRRIPLASFLTLFALLVPLTAFAVDLEVAELVDAIRRSIAEAQRSAQKPSLRIPWIEAEVSYVIKKEGSGGLKMYVVTADGKYATEAVQRVKVRLEPLSPLRVDGPGEIYGPIAGVDIASKKVFLGGETPAGIASWKAVPAFPFAIKNDTQIVDSAGGIKKLGDLKPGARARVLYEPTGDELTAKKIVIDP